jgi:pimeloyl-ACP methyl ester carboxylesterase
MHAATNTIVTAMLNRYLKCDPSAAPSIETAGMLASDHRREWTAARAVAAPPLADRGCLAEAAPLAPAMHADLPVDSGASIAADVYGSGADTVVLIPGFSTDGRVFGDQARGLSPAMRVVTIDLPGRGSARPSPTAPFGADGLPATADDPYSVGHDAEAVFALIESLDLDRVHLVGWSSGGQVALAIALEHPGSPRLRTLTLAGSGPATHPLAAHPQYPGGGTFEFKRALLTAMSSSAPQAVETWRPLVELFFAPTAPSSLVDDLLPIVASIPQATRAGVLATLTETASIDLSRLGEIALPTLVIHGEQDDAMVLESSLFMAEQIPSATLAIFQRSGHAAFIEEADRFNRTLLAFILAH